MNQQNVIGDLKYKARHGAATSLSVVRQAQNLPGGPDNLHTGLPDHAEHPAGLGDPVDGENKGHQPHHRFHRHLGPGVDLIVDGGVRRKYQQSLFFNYFNDPAFTFDPASAGPMTYVDTVMTTSS